MVLFSLLAVLATQSEQLKFVRPADNTFAGRTEFQLSTSIDPDDIVGIELQVNGEYAHYFEEEPYSAELNMKSFPEGKVEIKAILEFFDGKTIETVYHGNNIAPDIEEDVTLIRVPVLAERPNMTYKKSDFLVYENGIKQDIKMMLGQEKPMYLVVVLDMSTSMEKRLLLLRRSMETLIERVRPGDILHVIGFNHRVFEVSEPETDMSKVKERLSLMEAKGDTNLYGALYSGLKILGRSNERRALLLFTDGDHTVLPKDDLYGKNKEDCIDLARENGVPIYTVGFGVKVNRKSLDEISLKTGGKAFFKAASKDLARAFDSIGQELHHQYLLCYYTRSRLGWHDIKVELKGDQVPLLFPKRMYFKK